MSKQDGEHPMKIKEKIKGIIAGCTELHTEHFGDVSVRFADFNAEDATNQLSQLFEEEEKRELFRLIEDEEPNAFARLYPKLSRYLKGE